MSMLDSCCGHCSWARVLARTAAWKFIPHSGMNNASGRMSDDNV